MNTKVGVIVLAAGKGKRMKAPENKNKVIFELNRKPMIWYTYQMLVKAGAKKIIVVVGHAASSVKKVLGASVTYAYQPNPLGTGDAVKTALTAVSGEINQLIVMYGDDSAFYSPQLIKSLINQHNKNKADLSLVSIIKNDPTGLGRVVRDNNGNVVEIVEEKNATLEQKNIREINTGLYCFNLSFIKKAVDRIVKNPISGEYYLTDVVNYAVVNRYRLHSLLWPDENIWFGINTLDQLREAEIKMNQKG